MSSKIGDPARSRYDYNVSDRGSGSDQRKHRAQVRLAPEQFSELNATLYESDPAAYFRLRLQALVMQLSDSPHVDDALTHGLSYGIFRLGSLRREEPNARLRYAALESTVLLHHAGETLFRLYFSHLGEPDCPWLEIAKFRGPPDFKKQLQRLVAKGKEWNRSDVTTVFLGGASPADAGVEVTDEGWRAATDGLVNLLKLVAQRLLKQSDLYNAAKHGLVGVPAEGGSTTWTPADGGESLTLGGGPAVTFLHREPAVAAHDATRWHATTSYVRLDADFMVTLLIASAIDSLWAVARRRYVGQAGAIKLFDRDQVLVAHFASQIASAHMAEGVTYNLPIAKREADDWSLQPADIKVNIVPPGEEAVAAYSRLNRQGQSTETVQLPLRAQDARPNATRRSYLLPFSPPGSQAV